MLSGVQYIRIGGLWIMLFSETALEDECFYPGFTNEENRGLDNSISSLKIKQLEFKHRSALLWQSCVLSLPVIKQICIKGLRAASTLQECSGLKLRLGHVRAIQLPLLLCSGAAAANMRLTEAEWSGQWGMWDSRCGCFWRQRLLGCSQMFLCERINPDGPSLLASGAATDLDFAWKITTPLKLRANPTPPSSAWI